MPDLMQVELLTADAATAVVAAMTFSEALEKVYQARIGTGWQKCVIPTGSLVDGEGRLECNNDTQLLDVSFLAPLREAKNEFIPEKVCFRAWRDEGHV